MSAALVSPIYKYSQRIWSDGKHWGSSFHIFLMFSELLRHYLLRFNVFQYFTAQHILVFEYRFVFFAFTALHRRSAFLLDINVSCLMTDKTRGLLLTRCARPPGSRCCWWLLWWRWRRIGRSRPYRSTSCRQRSSPPGFCSFLLRSISHTFRCRRGSDWQGLYTENSHYGVDEDTPPLLMFV